MFCSSSCAVAVLASGDWVGASAAGASVANRSPPSHPPLAVGDIAFGLPHSVRTVHQKSPRSPAAGSNHVGVVIDVRQPGRLIAGRARPAALENHADRRHSCGAQDHGRVAAVMRPARAALGR